MKNHLLKFIRLSTLVSIPASLFTITLNFPATAASFGACASSLIDSGITGEQAATACADALEPKELSACVEKIKNNTAIAGEEALQACYRVRRPAELASCVTSINDQVGGEGKLMALNNCRSSLLPKRYADCVTGLTGSIPNLSGAKAMESCISAETFPPVLFPGQSN
ncbi:hypothetical protein Sta7437_1018 [Stanieria cyanosphaera PCC 7437]|uniref:Uncharacterized protein n=1 Tax=Stanieria cyanosphaera (strain ATCC 29371 / PCC 7437) TaxID=111780 RepID=K9XQ10_STAC7|nr:hypothetical protein [Stanieria cyanosphaera]AFZ34598.1 hypothetical protein Sta7437_1018 [Stanieria cyanosphaera PCC 7437]